MLELSITERNDVYGKTVDSVQVNYTFTPEGFWSQKEIIKSSKRVDKDKNGNYKDPVFNVVKGTTLYLDIKKDDEGNIIEYKEKAPNGKINVEKRSVVYY